MVMNSSDLFVCFLYDVEVIFLCLFQSELMKEAEVMKTMNHKHIVRMIGKTNSGISIFNSLY